MRLCFRDYSGNVLNRVTVTGIDTPAPTFRTLGAIRDWNLIALHDGEAVYAPAGVGKPPWADELLPSEPPMSDSQNPENRAPPDPHSQPPKTPSRIADPAETSTKIPREVK